MGFYPPDSAQAGRIKASTRAARSECLRLGQVFASRQKSLGVLWHTRNPHFKVQVWTCGAPSGADSRDLLATFDDIAFFHVSL